MTLGDWCHVRQRRHRHTTRTTKSKSPPQKSEQRRMLGIYRYACPLPNKTTSPFRVPSYRASETDVHAVAALLLGSHGLGLHGGGGTLGGLVGGLACLHLPAASTNTPTKTATLRPCLCGAVRCGLVRSKTESIIERGERCKNNELRQGLTANNSTARVHGHELPSNNKCMKDQISIHQSHRTPSIWAIENSIEAPVGRGSTTMNNLHQHMAWAHIHTAHCAPARTSKLGKVRRASLLQIVDTSTTTVARPIGARTRVPGELIVGRQELAKSTNESKSLQRR